MLAVNISNYVAKKARCIHEKDGKIFGKISLADLEFLKYVSLQ